MYADDALLYSGVFNAWSACPDFGPDFWHYTGPVVGGGPRFLTRFVTRVFGQGLGDRNIQFYSYTGTEK